MRAWLEARRQANGDELKKTLRPAAEAEFGEAFTVRAFNAAYAACYRRARGRPRRGSERWRVLPLLPPPPRFRAVPLPRFSDRGAKRRMRVCSKTADRT
jgi:hypothetical protein